MLFALCRGREEGWPRLSSFTAAGFHKTKSAFYIQHGMAWQRRFLERAAAASMLWLGFGVWWWPVRGRTGREVLYEYSSIALGDMDRELVGGWRQYILDGWMDGGMVWDRRNWASGTTGYITQPSYLPTYIR